MRLYVHHGNSVTALSVPETSNTQHLIDKICQVLKFSSVRVSKHPRGNEINPETLISTFFDPFDDVFVTKTEEKKQEALHLPPPEALQFTSLSKYSFYEYDNNWVRVEVPFPSINKHPKDRISCKFDVNSFVLAILDHGGKNFQFSVMRLQCNIQPEACKYSVLADKIRISLRKVKETDNWFSLFKTKTIGGDD